MAKSDVLLAYLHPDEVGANFHKCLLDLIGHDLSNDGRLHSWAEVKCTALAVPAGRNNVCSALLDSPCEWVLMVDADMGFQPATLDMLLSVADPVERPIVGGLTFAQREVGPDGLGGFRCLPQPVIMDWQEHPDGVYRFTGRRHYPVNSLVRCGATGGAMLLVHRSVIEGIRADAGPVWFDQIREDNGALIGEDVSFFNRVRELGFPVHVHTGIRTNHYKHLWVSETDFWTSFLAPPATELVDVVIPVLHRPENVGPLMESLRASTGLATAYFVCEPDDGAEIAMADAWGGVVLSDPTCHTFAEKVNLAYRATSAPWLLLVGDDVRFRAGWLDQAQDIARRYDADVIGTNDLANPRVTRGEHATHPMIRRTYVDKVGASWDGPGVVCHEGYRHWYVDDEIVTKAKQHHTFQAALGSQVEHFHPAFGTAEMDAVYAEGQAHAEVDEKLFRKRWTRYARASAAA